MREKCGLTPEKSLLLGFSGGPDSLCLLNLLVDCGYQVTAAHLDHGLRESSSDQAEQAVQLCRERGVNCILRKVDAAENAIQHKQSIEESARELRYQFLFSEAARCQSQAVLVGHNADDQVETVMMHLIRGSGLSGLAGMRYMVLPNQWSSTIPLVRPLLDYFREEIDQYLEEHHFRVIIDESNKDTRYFRNRIRHELIPYLETFNPQFKVRIMRMSEVVTNEDQLLVEETERNWQKVILEIGERFLVLDRERVASLSMAMRRRMIQKCIHWMDNNLRDIDFDVIDRASQFCSNPTRTNRVDLLAGIELFLFQKDRLVMAFATDPLDDLWPQLQSRAETSLPMEGEVKISDHWKLIISKQCVFPETHDPFKGYVDAGKAGSRLEMSKFHPGDRFVPFGFSGKSVKLGDFWTNEGLPPRARGNWPLVRSGDSIIWIPGFRISENVKVDADSREIITLELIKTP